MAERKDKKKVIGEPMTDEQIKVFLDFPSEEGVDADFHVLEKAYRALRAEDFGRFIGFFQAQGRDLNARDPAEGPRPAAIPPLEGRPAQRARTSRPSKDLRARPGARKEGPRSAKQAPRQPPQVLRQRAPRRQSPEDTPHARLDAYGELGAPLSLLLQGSAVPRGRAHSRVQGAVQALR